MTKNIFSNIDLGGNSVDNIVIGSLPYDPEYTVEEGYVYYNILKKCLRVYSDGAWCSIVDKFPIVQSLPQTGQEDTVYLLDRGKQDDTYSAYVWRNNKFCQISGYEITTTVSWNDIIDKPDLLKASVRDVSGTDDKELYLVYE